MRKLSLSRFSLFLLCLLFIFACRKDETTVIDSDNDNPVTIEKIEAVVKGVVTDENGDFIENATVYMGNEESSTDLFGRFTITGSVDNKGALIKVTKPGYFDGIANVVLSLTSTSRVKFVLTKREIIDEFLATESRTVTLSNGSQVVFPPNSIKDENNNQYNGEVIVFMRYIDPESEFFSSTYPGDLMGIDRSFERVTLQSFGMLEVELEDPAGNPLNILTSVNMKVKVPDARLSEAPQSIPLWFLEDNSGWWSEDGIASLSNGFYEGNVNHFTTWNCDIPFSFSSVKLNILNCTNTCIWDLKVSSSDISNARIYTTDSEGNVTLRIPKNVEINISVLDNCSVEKTVGNFGPFTEDEETISVDLSSVQSLIRLISANVEACDNTPVDNGYLILETDLGNSHYIPTAVDGSINESILFCNGEQSGKVTLYNLDDQMTNDPPIDVNLTSDIPLGVVSACGVQNDPIEITGLGPDASFNCGDPDLQFSMPTATGILCPPATLEFIDIVNPTCSITRTWTATDDCGNTKVVSQTLTLLDQDSEKPTIENAVDIFLDCGSILPNDIIIMDNCGLFVVTFEDVADAPNCNGSDSIRTYTVTDICGNTTTATVTIRLGDDTGPSFNGVGSDGSYSCGETPVFSTPTASDNCSTATLTFVDTPEGSSCAGTNIRRTWTATDECGNTTTDSQLMSVVDNDSPIINGVGSNGTFECGDSPVFSNPTSSDNCSSATIDFVDVTTGSNCAGDIIKRTWTVTDDCGNTNTAEQTMEAIDIVKPVLTGIGANGTYTCGQTPVFSSPVGVDNCTSASVTFNNTTMPGTPCDIITRTWTATDGCGNTSTGSQTMTGI